VHAVEEVHVRQVRREHRAREEVELAQQRVHVLKNSEKTIA
jgi:hypothetical protein